jgi:hypothetical protein
VGNVVVQYLQSCALPPNPPQPPSPPLYSFMPVTAGLTSWYDTSSAYPASNVWADKSGNSRNGTMIGIGALQSQTAGTGGSSCAFNTVTGATTSQVEFGISITAFPFSLCGVSRYTPGANQRILVTATSGTNSLFGHYNGLAGIVFMSGFATNATTSNVAGSATDWVVTCVSAASSSSVVVYINGVNRTVAGTGFVVPQQLGINTYISNSAYADLSTFAATELLTWNVSLSTSQLWQVSSYLSTRYCLLLSTAPPPLSPPPLPPSPPPPLPSSRDAFCGRLTNRWMLDNVSVVDSVGTWSGTVMAGVTFTSGAASFDGSTGYINLGTRTFGGSLSVALWFQQYVNTLNNNVLFSFGAGGGTAYTNEFAFVANGGGSAPGSGPFIGYGTGSPVFLNTLAGSYGTYFPINTWVHVALTVNSATSAVTLFINGAQAYSGTATVPVAQRTMFIGRANYGTTQFLNGAVSDVQFAAGYVFTAGDVTNMYAGTGCPAPPPPNPPPNPPPPLPPPSPPPPSPPPSPPPPSPPPPSVPAVCIMSTADRLADAVAGSRTLYCKTTSGAGCSAGVVALAANASTTLAACAAACDGATGCAGFSFSSALACQLQSSGMPTGDAQPAFSGACFNTLPGDVLSTLVNLACPAGTFLAGQSCYFCPIGAYPGGCVAHAAQPPSA